MRKGVGPATVVFAAIIVAAIVCAFQVTFGPVKLLCVGAAVVAMIAIKTETRRTADDQERNGGRGARR